MPRSQHDSRVEVGEQRAFPISEAWADHSREGATSRRSQGDGSPRLPIRTPRCGMGHLRAFRRSVALISATFLAGAASSAATPPPPDVCLVLDPLLRLGCPQQQPASTGQATSQAAEFEQAPVRETAVVPRYDPRRLTVTFVRGTSRQTIDRVFKRAGVSPERAIPKIHAYMVGVPPERNGAALGELRTSPAVASAGREVVASALDTIPDDTAWPRQVGLRLVGFPKAWDVTHGSNRIVVAVLDTGVDPRQPDLRGAFVPGYDFVNSDADPADDEGHGT